jgi:mycothiol synthase
VRVEEIDAQTASDEQLLVFHEIQLACLPELVPGEPAPPPDETIAFYRHPPATQERRHWVAGNAGFGSLYVHSPTTAFIHLFVAPAERRRGTGTALLDAVRARAVERGLGSAFVHHATPGGAAFARRVGAVDQHRDVRALLDLRHAELTEPQPPPGWRLVTWIGRVPDEHVASYARARAAMDDAPAPDGLDLPAESVERVRAMEESLRRRERELRVTVALDEHDDVAAFTDVRVSKGARLGFTDDTGTVAAHRRRGLATAVKLESLRALRRDHPEVDVVNTTNAEDNVAMRTVNERLGFRVVATFTTARLAL